MNHKSPKPLTFWAKRRASCINLWKRLKGFTAFCVNHIRTHKTFYLRAFGTYLSVWLLVWTRFTYMHSLLVMLVLYTAVFENYKYGMDKSATSRYRLLLRNPLLNTTKQTSLDRPQLAFAKVVLDLAARARTSPLSKLKKPLLYIGSLLILGVNTLACIIECVSLWWDVTASELAMDDVFFKTLITFWYPYEGVSVVLNACLPHSHVIGWLLGLAVFFGVWTLGPLTWLWINRTVMTKLWSRWLWVGLISAAMQRWKKAALLSAGCGNFDRLPISPLEGVIFYEVLFLVIHLIWIWVLVRRLKRSSGYTLIWLYRRVLASSLPPAQRRGLIRMLRPWALGLGLSFLLMLLFAGGSCLLLCQVIGDFMHDVTIASGGRIRW